MSASGEIRERSPTSALQKRFLGRHRSLAVLRGVVPRSERFSDLFGVPSLSGHHRRNRPHGSRSPAGHPYRVARAKFDGDRLRAWVAGEMKRRLADLHRRIGALPPKRVLFVVWTQPLISVGKHTFIADALRLAGAASIVDSEQDWPQVSLEEVARLQPDLLVFAESHSDSASLAVEALATLPGWSIVEAVSKRRVAVISDAVNRPAPRIVSAIEDLAKQLHPDAFTEKPESNKEKIEKENPPPNHRPAAHSSFWPGNLQARMAIPGGCACAR